MIEGGDKSDYMFLYSLRKTESTELGETAAQRYYTKKLFQIFFSNSQAGICAGVSFQRLQFRRLPMSFAAFLQNTCEQASSDLMIPCFLTYYVV